MRHFSGRPRFLQNCTANLSATSTAVEPSSEKKNMLQRSGNDFPEARRELFGGLMREAREQNMFETRGLPGNGGCDGGVRVSVQVNPPGRYRVENPPAVLSFEEHAFRAANMDRRGVGTLVSEGMP